MKLPSALSGRIFEPGPVHPRGRAFVTLEVALTGAARLFLASLYLNCTFLGSLRAAERARDLWSRMGDRPRRAALYAAFPALFLTMWITRPSASGPLVGALVLLAALGHVVSLVAGLRRLREIVGQPWIRRGLRAPIVGRATFAAGLLVSFDGLLLSQGVTALCVGPIAILVQLVRAAADAWKGRRRGALERVAAAGVWLAGHGRRPVVRRPTTTRWPASARKKSSPPAAATNRRTAGFPALSRTWSPAYLPSVPRARITPFAHDSITPTTGAASSGRRQSS